jgi:hypothetical protein
VECNIDAHGKSVRFIWGLVMVCASAVLVALRLFTILTEDWWWIVIGVLALFGGLGIFEARAGWCVVRAMGVKTRL